jgi:Protein of unknown function (DUF664)
MTAMKSLQRITTGSERTLIENMLDRNRVALVDTVHGLSDIEARQKLVPSLTTPRMGLASCCLDGHPADPDAPPHSTPS